MKIERDVVAIDRHRLWIEEPYALMIEVNGDLEGESFRRMRDVMAIVGGGEGPVVIVQDLSKAGAFTASARKGIMDDPRTKRVVAVICIGASFQMRVFMGMITKALKIVNPNAVKVVFAKDEAEGRAMLEAERKTLSQK